jgi:hypothetical protein
LGQNWSWHLPKITLVKTKNLTWRSGQFNRKELLCRELRSTT